MAIRDRFRRSARKPSTDAMDLADAPTTLVNTGMSSLSTSPSSSTATSTTDLSKVTTVVSTTSSTSSSSSSSSSRRMRLPWSSGGRDKKRSSKNIDSCYGPLNKPFTETNLRHQEMFSTFTMTFGRQRRGSSGAWSYESGVSPLTSRHCSVVDLTAGGETPALA